MKVLKRQSLTLLLIVALVATLTLGIIFALPARPASVNAEEEFVPANTVTVSTEQALKDEVRKAGATATKIILDDDIEMNSITCGDPGTKYYELRVERGQNIQLDLAGHTLSVIPNPWSSYTIFNNGTLSIIDSSGDYSGKIISQGWIDAWYDDTWIYTWMQSSVIYNYGDLTIDANIGLEKPASRGEMGEDGFYNDSGDADVAMIVSSPYIPGADEADQTVSNSSVTVNGGTFTGYFETVFKLQDADLTINGGVFKTLKGTMFSTYLFTAGAYLRPQYWPAYYYDENGNAQLYEGEQEIIDAELQLQKEIVEKLKDNRHSNVQIKNGDFTAYTSQSPILKVVTNIVYYDSFEFNDYGGNYKQAVVEDAKAEISITISGGKWGKDLTSYVPQGCWMEHVYETAHDGSVVEDFYRVTFVDTQKAEASVTVNGKESFYSTFDSALTAAKSVQADTRTIKLLNDAQTERMVLRNFDGDLVLNLNGHKLTLELSSDTSHIESSNVYSHVNRLIIQDLSDDQTGELILSVKSGNPINSGGFIQLSLFTKYVLESGTIRQTGYLPKSYYDHTSDMFGQRNANMNYVRRQSLFQFNSQITASNVEQYEGMVTIKGGNIVSDLTFGTPDNVAGSRPGELVAWRTDTSITEKIYEFGLDDGIVSKELKARVFVVDLEDYLADATKACKFSWDLNSVVAEKGLTSSPSGDGYIVSMAGEEDRFLIGSTKEKVATLQAALAGAGDNDIISVLQDTTVSEAVEIGKGITLNLNPVAHFELTFENAVTLTEGVSIKNGVINGDVTVSGTATISNAKLKKTLTVTNSGSISLYDGTYDGNITVERGGKLTIYGGRFADTLQLESYDSYIYPGFGATDVENGYRTVKAGVVSLAAQTWYETAGIAKTAASGYGIMAIADVPSTYTINNEAEWLYFSSIVNSGTNSFAGDTVQIGSALDFKDSVFITAGTVGHAFAGTFDGNNKTMKNIVAQEYFVGLFGACTGDARFRNITLEDSSFNVGSGYFDEFNCKSGYSAAGALIGEGFLGGNAEGTDWSGNITLNNVDIGYVSSTYNTFNGGVIGHSWGDIKIDGLNFRNETTVSSNWKMGGVVGYLDGSFYIKKADIEEGTDGKQNGLVLNDEECWFPAGALVGHANGSNNTIENCTILEPDDSLIGTTYAGGTKSKITIKGAQTDLDIYQVVGAGRSPDSETVIEITGEATEEGISKGSVKTQKTEEYLKFTDEAGNDITPEPNPEGGYDVQATVHVTVVVCDITAEDVEYGKELQVSGFKLKDIYGHEVDFTGEDLTLTVTLKESKYNVGKQVALITSISIGGAAAGNYTLAAVGQQAFMEITVVPTTLYIGVGENGELTYDGFVNGDDESVLSGTGVVEKHGNVLTPSGLSSENYNIVFVSRTLTVDETTAETDLTALWVALAVVGAAAVVATGLYFGLRRKKQ